MAKSSPSKILRAIFALECALTLYAGIQALLAPAVTATQFIPIAPPSPALDFVRWLSAGWFAAAVLEAGLLWRGTREAWRVGLAALLVGDIVHVSAHAVMIAHGGTLDAPASASLLAASLFAGCRVIAWRRPELVVRAALLPPPGDARAG